MSTQIWGYSEKHYIETLCECTVEKFSMEANKEETCPNCNMVIIFKVDWAYKKVKILEPKIKKSLDCVSNIVTIGIF